MIILYRVSLAFMRLADLLLFNFNLLKAMDRLNLHRSGEKVYRFKRGER